MSETRNEISKRVAKESLSPEVLAEPAEMLMKTHSCKTQILFANVIKRLEEKKHNIKCFDIPLLHDTYVKTYIFIQSFSPTSIDVHSALVWDGVATHVELPLDSLIGNPLYLVYYPWVSLIILG